MNQARTLLVCGLAIASPACAVEIDGGGDDLGVADRIDERAFVAILPWLPRPFGNGVTEVAIYAAPQTTEDTECVFAMVGSGGEQERSPPFVLSGGQAARVPVVLSPLYFDDSYGRLHCDRPAAASMMWREGIPGIAGEDAMVSDPLEAAATEWISPVLYPINLPYYGAISRFYLSNPSGVVATVDARVRRSHADGDRAPVITELPTAITLAPYSVQAFEFKAPPDSAADSTYSLVVSADAPIFARATHRIPLPSVAGRPGSVARQLYAVDLATEASTTAIAPATFHDYYGFRSAINLTTLADADEVRASYRGFVGTNLWDPYDAVTPVFAHEAVEIAQGFDPGHVLFGERTTAVLSAAGQPFVATVNQSHATSNEASSYLVPSRGYPRVDLPLLTHGDGRVFSVTCVNMGVGPVAAELVLPGVVTVDPLAASWKLIQPGEARQYYSPAIPQLTSKPGIYNGYLRATGDVACIVNSNKLPPDGTDHHLNYLARERP